MKSPYNGSGAGRQNGFALVVALIILVIITLVALGSLRSTTLQTRMAANLYDRALALQNAESALMAAQAQVAAIPDIAELSGTSCTSSDGVCPPTPLNTWTADSTGWVGVDATYQNNSTLYPANSQYHVDYLGVKEVDNDDEINVDITANTKQYGEQMVSSSNKRNVFRVTVRSNPNGGDGRSNVVLQSLIEVPQ